MKKIISVLLTAIMLMTSAVAFAENEMYIQLADEDVMMLLGNVSTREEEYGTVYTIDTNTTITTLSDINEMYIDDASVKDGDCFFMFTPEHSEGFVEAEDSNILQLSAEASRDSADSIAFLAAGAVLKFNAVGEYRISLGKWIDDLGDWEYTDCLLEVTEAVEEDIYTEPTLEDLYIRSDLYTISNIVSFEQRTVVYEDTVAVCTPGAVVKATKDLKHFMIVPIINQNGIWVEDEDNGLTYDMAADLYGTGFVSVSAGDSYTLSEPGYYSVWVDDYDGGYWGNTVQVISPEAKYTTSKVLVNGNEVAFEAYNINDNNYFKLRDLAMALNGTEKQFEVVWDSVNSCVNMMHGPYTAVGGELAAGDGMDKTAAIGTKDIRLNGEPVDLAAFLINDNNYFKLRDLGMLFYFNVGWDGANNCIMIDTSAGYIY